MKIILLACLGLISFSSMANVVCNSNLDSSKIEVTGKYNAERMEFTVIAEKDGRQYVVTEDENQKGHIQIYIGKMSENSTTVKSISHTEGQVPLFLYDYENNVSID